MYIYPMNSFNHINAEYKHPSPFLRGDPGFIRIWHVEADRRYRENRVDLVQRESHSLFLTWEGQGAITLETSGVTLPAPSLIYLPRATKFNYKTGPDGLWRFYFISFHSDSWLRELSLFPLIPHPVTDRESIKALGRGIIASLVRQLTGYRREPDLLLQTFLLGAGREHLGPGTGGEDRLDRLIDWIHQNRRRPLETEDMRRRTGLTRSAFYRRFKDKTGVSPGRYLRDLKMDEAARLLVQTELKVYEIARAVGFHDEFHFSRQFKSCMGRSPRDYRRKRAE